MATTKRRARRAAAIFLPSLLLAVVPTILVHADSQFRWVCRRDGPRAGQCYAEPTIRHRLGLLPWDESYPRMWTMQIVDIVDLGGAERAGDGSVRIRSSEACWKSWSAMHSWCWGSGRGAWWMPVSESSLFGPSDERDFVERFNAFLRDPSERSFVHQPRAPYEPWHALFYVAAGLALAVAMHRSTCAHRRAWRMLDDTPSVVASPSPYRGQVIPSHPRSVDEGALRRLRRPTSRRRGERAGERTSVWVTSLTIGVSGNPHLLC